MKITDWLRKLRPRPQSRPDYRELQELSEKARRAAGVSNYEELAKLIREYRNSDEAVESIALIIAKSEPFISPASATNRYAIEMMEVLADTPFMEKHGSRLSDIAVEDASPEHGLIAMYTFMRDAAMKDYQAEGMARPEHTEVASAGRILDYRRHGRDISELCDLALYADMPSGYVKMRYGLGDVCLTYSYIERYLLDNEASGISTEMRKDHTLAQADMCKAAEKEVESIPGVRLPDFYLEYLDRELEKLGRIAVSPDTVNDLIHISPYFLTKYGINRNASPEEQSRQAQKAYCELDSRCVRMTGRRPYADSLVAALDKKAGETNTSADKVKQQPVVRNHIRNPPPSRGKGCKPSF